MSSATASICKGCGKPKSRQHYLCRPCWMTLPQRARTALSQKDTRSLRRLSDLFEQLRAGVPLTEIEIADV